MGRRTLLLLVGTLGACLICCVVVFFVALPRTRDSVNDAIRESMTTQVARVVAPIGTAEPGTYTITDTELLNQFNDRLTGGSVPIENLNVVITPEHIELSFHPAVGMSPTPGRCRLLMASSRWKRSNHRADSWISCSPQATSPKRSKQASTPI